MNNNHEPEIGQIIYILSEKTTKVIPAIVSEQVSIKTLEGDTITWKVQIGPEGSKRKTYNLDSVKGDKYYSLEEVKEVLQERLLEFLNSTLSEASARTTNWYGPKTTDNQPIQVEEVRQLDPDSLLDEIESPTPGNNIPHYAASPSTTLSTNSQEMKEAVRNKIKLAITPTTEEINAEIRTITDEHGNLVPINQQ